MQRKENNLPFSQTGPNRKTPIPSTKRMEEAEKMAALKKAYAEIILNTAKEAASRIMASERKALRFQQDMLAAKEEALNMLIRLKQTTDSKISEAEITSLSQQRRIEELEAQLQEAEDKVTELRAELKRVEDELEKVKHNRMETLDAQTIKQDPISQEDTSNENSTSGTMYPPNSGPLLVANSDMMGMDLCESNTDNKCCNGVTEIEPLGGSPKRDYYAGNTDLASIIMRNKEPELYRNGCTQRIRAFEQNLMDGRLPLCGQKDDLNLHIKNESIIKQNENVEETGPVPSPQADNRGIEKTPNEFEDFVQHDSKQNKVEAVKLTPSRKKTQYRNMRAISCRSNKIGTLEDNQGGEGCIIASSEAEAECMGMIEKNPIELEKVMHHDNSCEKCQPCKRGRRRRRKPTWRTKASLCKTYPCPVNESIEYGEDPSEMMENESQKDTEFDFGDGLTSNTTETNSQLRFAGGSESTLVTGTEIIQNVTNKDVTLVDNSDSVLMRQEMDAAESSGIPVCELNLGKVDVPSIGSDLKDEKSSEATNGASTQSANDRILKYTFRRKRKKESLSIPDENISVEKKNSSKKRAGEKHSDDSERQKSTLVIESSRDSRRLVQVARQLISLSAKKWW